LLGSVTAEQLVVTNEVFSKKESIVSENPSGAGEYKYAQDDNDNNRVRASTGS